MHFKPVPYFLRDLTSVEFGIGAHREDELGAAIKVSVACAPLIALVIEGQVPMQAPKHVAMGSVSSPPSAPQARAVTCPMCSDLLQTLRTLASDLLYPALPRSPCSQAPTEPLNPLGRMDEEEDPEGTPGPNSAGAPHARSTISCAANHACTPPSCTAAPSLHARSLVLAVCVPMIYSCHRRHSWQE